MTYDKDIPDFALQPARDPDEQDAFDPSPYDRLLNFHSKKQADELEKETKPVILPEVTEELDLDSIGEINIESEEELDLEVEMKKTSEVEFEPNEDISIPNFEVETKEENDTIEEVKSVVTEQEQESEPEVELVSAPDFESESAPEAEPVSAPDFESESEPEAEPVSAPVFESESEPEVAPVSAPAPEANKEPVAEPVNAAMPNAEASVIVPLAGTLVTNELKMTDIREKPETRVYVEEDILVPDTKEDLASILSMTGNPRLSDSEIRVGQVGQDSVKVTGEIELHTLYIPESYSSEEHIINIQSRLPFKTECNTSVAPLSRLAITPSIESIDYTVINERKFRAKLTVKLTMREYANVEMQVFQGIRGEKLQLLKEKIQMTHVSERKTDVMSINEVFAVKDTQPMPERILKYDVDIVENHKQITEDKAVVNATVYCNVLYLGRNRDADSIEAQEMTENVLTPQLFQGKSEFTQFIPILNPAEGSKISFNYNNLTMRIKEPDAEESLEKAFALEGDVETVIEIYKNLEREIVTDIYHRNKEVICDKVELEAMSLGGSGVTEAAVREIINVPEQYGEVKKVIYIYGDVKNCRSFLEQNKNVVEGVVDITLLCLPEDSSKAAFRLNKEVNFRGAMEIPMGMGDTKANSDIAIKELWFDRINAKQIEVNANLFISSSVYGQDKYEVIQNVCFVESKEEPGSKPGMVVYITKENDTLWSIAKKYRTTMEMITEINELGEEHQLTPGKKLLIVK